MSPRFADLNPNYQQRARDFAVGDLVVPYGHGMELAGHVVALFPAIGMADVEFPAGSKRYPVEDLQRLDPENAAAPLPPRTDSVPGGTATAEVSGGPEGARVASRSPEAVRVAQAYVKRALYWHSSDRRYRATNPEVVNGQYVCPNCKGKGAECYLKPAIYKRRGGKSERLLGCPECLFLVKRLDIVNDPAAVETAQLEATAGKK